MYNTLKPLLVLFPLFFWVTALSALDWNLLSSVSWCYEGKLVAREDARIALPWNLSLRAQIIDSRPTATAEAFGSGGNTAFSGALYHKPSDSRLLYGILSDEGLSTRLRNLWLHAVPFVEYHKPSSLDLATEPYSTKTPDVALTLSIPRWGVLDGFATLVLDEEANPAVSAGIDARFDSKTAFRLEGFYTGTELAPRKQSAWFSASPALPARDFDLYALSVVYTSAWFDVASDCAFSDTFAYGRAFYGNLALCAGDKPWRASLAADCAGSRYVGSNGTASGAGFRLGTKLERFGERTSRFTLSTSLRAPELFSPFDRSASLIAYRFATRPRGYDGLFSLTRCAVSVSRNATQWKKIEDKAEVSCGFTIGQVSGALSETLTAYSATESRPPPYPIPAGMRFASAKTCGTLLYRVSVFQFSVALGYSVRHDKPSLWDTAFHASVRGALGRVALEVTAPELPTDWTFTLSARCSLP
ncbi:MAG: hypothetical protein LBS86_04100 [Treponema sp.]|jgi:hypothetical protein|nr:hypothetical protein [Treponema sp.]